MNTTKLTLSIPKKVLSLAKAYSAKTDQPLSQLVSRYFLLLAKTNSDDDRHFAISDRVKSVTGIAKSSVDDDELLFKSLNKKYGLK